MTSPTQNTGEQPFSENVPQTLRGLMHGYSWPMRHLDPSAALTVILASVFGSELSTVIGPYAVIVLAATTGAGWGLGRCGPLGKWGGAWYFLKLNLTAILVTVPLSTGVQSLLGWQDADWLLVPVGLFVGGVGNDWPKVGVWFVKWIGRLIEKRSGTEGS